MSSAPNSFLCILLVWLELGLCQLHVFTASWLSIRWSRRKGRAEEKPSFLLFACNSQTLLSAQTVGSSSFFVFFFFTSCILFYFFYFLTLQYCSGFAICQHESATGIHVFPILKPPPSSLPIPSLWVVPVHQPQASSMVHWTWTGNLFHIWYYICFNAILPNHPNLFLSHRVQKTVLYISVSFAVSYTGLL